MVRRMWLTLLALFLAGCSVALGNSMGDVPGRSSSNDTGSQPIVQANLNSYGPAPELNNDVWLNSDQPLRLKDLRGKVVLIDMWTYG